MKKVFYSIFLFVASAAVLTSCQKEVAPIVEQSLSARLANDSDFQKMMESTVAMASSFSGESIDKKDSPIILEILKKGNKATVSEIEFVKEKLGASPEKFGAELATFFGSLESLEKTYSLSN
jgi:uncharacterized alpha/beta hydrolase family protein